MGVRLVRYSYSHEAGSTKVDHDELINRDLLNQHPIYAITGLQEVLNTLEDSVTDVGKLVSNTNTSLIEIVNNVQKNIDDVNKSIDEVLKDMSELNTIESVKDTNSVHLDYDKTKKELSADVKIYKAKNNAIQELVDGLYVPKIEAKDTSTITWSQSSNGESLVDIFNDGIKFSHMTSSWDNLYNATEANSWYWDDTLQSFVQPNNTETFNGFVTKDFYDCYTHTATIKSTDTDNDVNGIIIAYMLDENLYPHTLSALCIRRGWNDSADWLLVYDYCLPDQQILFKKGNGSTGTVPNNSGSSGWNNVQTNGITIKATKNKNIIEVSCSNWNSTTINKNTTITIDLNDYSWGRYFLNEVRYGYCNLSQPYSYFTNIEFSSMNTISSDKIFASVMISQDITNEISIKQDGIYAPKFEISNENNNALQKKNDGYYVEDFIISPQDNNALTKLSDGYYVESSTNYKIVTQKNHSFQLGDFIYYHPNGEYKLAKAIDSYDSNIVGMIIEVIDTDTFKYMWSGFFATNIFSTDNNIIQGMPLYISDVDAGKVVQQQPDISKTVGYPVENIGIIISIERGIQYNQEASIGDFKSSANTYTVRSDGFIMVVENTDYKQSLVVKLLESLSDSFKSRYILLDNVNNTMRFINTNELYVSNGVPTELNLFIKAF